MLSETKQRLLEKRLKGEARRSQGIVARRPEEMPVPLSFAQQRLWFLDQLQPESSEYNVPLALRLDGPLDVDALRAALDAIVERHEVLRTRLVEVDGVALQAVDPPAGFALEILDGAASVESALEADATAPFDLATGPLFRGRLIHIGPREHVLSLVVHHAVCDEWSLDVLRSELISIYRSFCNSEPSSLAPLPVQYGDFAIWQRERLQGKRLDAQLDYWKTHLAGAPALDLPTDRPRPRVRTPAGSAVDFELDAEVVAGLQELARGSGATLFMTLLAGFAVLLGRYAGHDDVVIGTPIANRSRPEFEGLIGFFVNTLVMRIDLSGDPTFDEVVSGVRGDALTAYAHQDLPFEQLVEAIQPHRDRSRTPLFQVLFNFEQTDADPNPDRSGPQPEGENEGGLEVSEVSVPEETARFDLTLVLSTTTNAGLSGALEYSTDLFERRTVEMMTGHLVELLQDVAREPDRPLSSLTRLSASESRQLVDAGTGPASADGHHQTRVVELVDERVTRTPEAIAVRFGEEVLTYAELDVRANQLANHMRRQCAAMPVEAVVGLCVERGPDVVVAALAVLKAGWAYLPLDPDYPVGRLEFMVRDSGATLVLGHRRHVNALSGADTQTIALDDAATAAAITASSTQATPARVLADQLAYIIYTSGSTGRPKGVMATHGGLVNLVEAQRHGFGVSADDVVLQFAPFSFDAATAEIWVALAAGATLCIAPAEVRSSPAELAELIANTGVSLATLPPSLLGALDPADLPATTRLVSAGEHLPHELARRWSSEHRLLDAYGPTETTVCASIGEPPSIGTPLVNTRLYVLDQWMGMVPQVVLGELHIGGVGVARGYRNNPKLSAERFVADPFAADGSRLYRSGDRVRWRDAADGLELEFHGRIDEQVKVRGYRIEPGEVGAALLAHPDIAAAAVVALENDGFNRLAAYIVARDSSAGVPATDALREFLEPSLPAHMVPELFVELASIPRSPNGKLDRAALPAPGSHRPTLRAPYRPPSGSTEQLLAGVWSEVLGIDDPGADDNFFALGGHSLLGTQMMARLRKLFHVDLPLAELFDHPTVAGLARVIDAGSRGEPAPVAVPRARRDGDLLPLSFAQQRLWVFDQMQPGSTDYNVPLALPLDGPLDVGALQAALAALVERHEVLRSRLVTREGVGYQVVDSPDGFELDVVEARGDSGPDGLEALLAADATTSFDLAEEPPFRARLIRVAPDEHVLSLVTHHVVADERSVGLLHRDLMAFYESHRSGAPAALSPLEVQYADFAAWQRDWLQGEVLDKQLAYWLDRLSGAPSLELPTDKPRPAVRTSQGSIVDFEVPQHVVASLRGLARETDSTMFMTLLAGFAVLLSRHSGQDDFVIGTPVDNRTQVEFENLIGFFVNTLVLHLDLSGDPSIAEIVHRVRNEALGGYAHQDLPFERLVEELQLGWDDSRTPLAQVLFNYDPAAALGSEPNSDNPTAVRVAGASSQVRALTDVRLLLADNADGGLDGTFEYSTDLFERATVERWARHLVALLEAMVSQ